MKKLKDKFEKFQLAYSRLKEACSDPIVSDRDQAGVVQTFEFTYEMSWKLLKAVLEYEGVSSETTARAIFNSAYANNFIDSEEIWLKMIADRNLTNHTYDQETANSVVSNIQNEYLNIFGKLNDFITKKYPST